MNAIVVTDKQWAIGRNGDLLFSLPGDMKHFRTLTTGGTVIMGRKTLDSFPGGRPLPKRRNTVITRSPDFHRVYITKIFADGHADAFFPDLDALPNWKIERTGEAVTENGLTYRFVDYVNTALL